MINEENKSVESLESLEREESVESIKSPESLKYLVRKEKEEKAINRLKNLNQYKNLSRENLKNKVLESQKRKAEGIDSINSVESEELFSDKGLKKRREQLFRRYLKEFAIENISDRNTLRQLIFLEITNERLEIQLNKLFKNDKVVPTHAVDILHKNTSQILELKSSLKLIKDNTKKGDYDRLATIIKKYKIWKEQNIECRTRKCPHCAGMIRFNIRADRYELTKHPFFKDNVLYNKELIRLYFDNRLTKEEVAKILETSNDYIDWVIEKIWKPTQGRVEQK